MQKSYFGDFMVLKRAVGMGIITSPEMKKNANKFFFLVFVNQNFFAKIKII
jgi:hypothetical protein